MLPLRQANAQSIKYATLPMALFAALVLLPPITAITTTTNLTLKIVLCRIWCTFFKRLTPKAVRRAWDLKLSKRIFLGRSALHLFCVCVCATQTHCHPFSRNATCLCVCVGFTLYMLYVAAVGLLLLNLAARRQYRFNKHQWEKWRLVNTYLTRTRDTWEYIILILKIEGMWLYQHIFYN